LDSTALNVLPDNFIPLNESDQLPYQIKRSAITHKDYVELAEKEADEQ